MREYTKDNPGTYSELLEYLADKEGTYKYNELVFTSLEQAKKHKWYKASNCHLIYNGQIYMHPRIQTRKGGGHFLTIGYDNLEVPMDTQFEKIWINQSKDLKDFKTEVQLAGTYKACEGGGWYSNVAMFLVDGKFFACY